MGIEHLKPHQFRPGESGNPSGRPKGAVSLTRIMRQILSENDGQKARDLIEAIVTKAIDTGDANLLKQIMERMDGKVPDVVRVTRDLDEMTQDELEAERDRLLRAIRDGDDDGADAD